MPKVLTVRDTGYTKGMNTVDDPKILSDGECAELVNAYPGYPLRHRKGCWARALEVSGAVMDKTFNFIIDGCDYLLFWADTAGPYKGLYALQLNVPDSSPVAVTLVGSGAQLVSAEVGERGGTVASYAQVNKIAYVSTPSAMFAVYPDGDIFRAYRVPVGVDFTEFAPTFANTVPTPLPVPQGKAGHYADPENKVDDGTNAPYVSFRWGFSATFVRRSGSASEPIETYAHGEMETPEIVSKRGVNVALIYDGDSPGIGQYFAIPVKITLPQNISPEYGFTHVRLYRSHNVIPLFSDNQTRREQGDLTNGATRYFLVDIPVGMFVGGEYEYVDAIPDAALLGEMNLLASFDYMFPPRTGRMHYFKERLFIADERGQVCFSEIPGGDGGSDLETAQSAANKYALWFKPLHYRLDLAAAGGFDITGIQSLNNDLYLFTRNKIFTVPGGDPVTAPLSVVDDRCGCAFPETITRLKLNNESVLYFQSDVAPQIMRQGGYIDEFTAFKIRELFKRANGDLVTAAIENVEWCSAAYWDDVLWMFFKVSGRSAQIYGCLLREDASGAFKVEIGVGNKVAGYVVRSIVTTQNNKAFALGIDGQGNELLVSYLGGEDYYDNMYRYSTMPVFRLVSRKMFPGPKERAMSELFRVVTYSDFSGEPESGPEGSDLFRLTVFNNRYRSGFDYISGGVENPDNTWENNTPLSRATLRRCISFVLRADFVGEYFQYCVEKTVPRATGHFHWYSVEMEALPRPQLDTERFAGAGFNGFAGLIEARIPVYVGVVVAVRRVVLIGELPPQGEISVEIPVYVGVVVAVRRSVMVDIETPDLPPQTRAAVFESDFQGVTYEIAPV